MNKLVVVVVVVGAVSLLRGLFRRPLSSLRRDLDSSFPGVKVSRGENVMELVQQHDDVPILVPIAIPFASLLGAWTKSEPHLC